MPLREADLRNLEVCKRAVRQDAQAIRGGAALRFFIYQNVKVEKEVFALFPVLMDDRAIRGFMAQNGSTLLCHGICHPTGDGRALVFETESKALNATLLKKSLDTLIGVQQIAVRIIASAQPAKARESPQP
jgi:hypothetical protein